MQPRGQVSAIELTFLNGTLFRSVLQDAEHNGSGAMWSPNHSGDRAVTMATVKLWDGKEKYTETEEVERDPTQTHPSDVSLTRPAPQA
jgi:hypothetical protein